MAAALVGEPLPRTRPQVAVLDQTNREVVRTVDIDGRRVRADDLRFLAAVANTGRLTTAAHALGVDHTTVSRRLRVLEKVLGARLIEHGPDGWELTEAGRPIVEHARVIQNAVDLVTRAAAGAQDDSVTGTVRVTASDGFGTLFVVPALARVQAQHPKLSVELITGARGLSLRDPSFDLAMTLSTPPVTRLFTERLCEYDSAFYASDAYLAEHGDPVSLDELKEHALIFFVDSLQRRRELQLSSYISEASAQFSSTNVFAQLEATRLGAGIALLPKFVARTAPEVRPVAVKMPPPRVAIALAARRDAMVRRDVLVVRDALHEEVRSRRHELI
jgi:DNA-binding transcriptional LysR family regulator